MGSIINNTIKYKNQLEIEYYNKLYDTYKDNFIFLLDNLHIDEYLNLYCLMVNHLKINHNKLLKHLCRDLSISIN